MKFVIVFPGRFQPAHRGHYSVYDALAKKFGERQVFIATTDKQAPLTSPFSFSDKVKMWTTLGVSASQIVKVKSPYNPVEIVGEVSDQENTALIMAVSEKDMLGDAARFKFGTKKDGSPSYLQPYPGDGEVLHTMNEHAYVMIAPTATFKIGDRGVRSATEIREAYIRGNDLDRMNIIHDLYGVDDPTLKQMFDDRLDAVKSTADTLKEARKRITLCESRTRDKLSRLIESVRKLEAEVEGVTFVEDLLEDYAPEK